MTYDVVNTEEATAQIEDVYRWITRRAPKAAARWYARLKATAQSLESLPQRCPLAPESAALGVKIRQLLYGKRGGVFRLLFIISKKRVIILHVLHGSRRQLGYDDLRHLLIQGLPDSEN